VQLHEVVQKLEHEKQALEMQVRKGIHQVEERDKAMAFIESEVLKVKDALHIKEENIRQSVAEEMREKDQSLRDMQALIVVPISMIGKDLDCLIMLYRSCRTR